MLKREAYLRHIADSLGILEFAVTNRGVLRLFDLNVVAESFFAHVLNVIYGLNLQNLNDERSMPGLDLGDESAKVAFQVSSESSHAKLQKTIDKVIHWELYKKYFYKKYSSIRVLVIGKKQKLYRKPFDTQGLFSFLPSNDVVDIRDLVQELQRLTTPQLEQLHGIIRREFNGLGTEQGISNQPASVETAGESLERASHDLISWPQTLPGGDRLARPELDVLLQKIDEFESSATVLLGPPGSGKSALLAQVALAIVEKNWPILAIKADVLDPEIADEAGLQRHLMLDEMPSILLSRLAAHGPAVLIIDQLDALAGFVDLRTGRLNVLLHLIRKLARRQNVHIVISARTFEFNHDVRLRSIEADTLNLELPPWSQILPVLSARNLQPEGWPADAQEALRTPQHLATFLRLVDSGTAEPFQNYQAMLERLWVERVLQASNGEQLARLATDIANVMAEEESLWLARSRYDDRAKDLLQLERLEILKKSADGLSIGFTHQTLYDYVLARSFVRSKGRLSAYVAGREASLFIRPKLWVALNYLRNVEVTVYEAELVTIWESERLRPHLKLLLIEFMGQQREPTATERQLMRPVLESGPDRPAALRAIAGSPGWFNAVAGSAIATAMRESEQTAWLVTSVLQQAWGFGPERVLSLIQQHWAHDARFDPHLWTVLSETPAWSDAIADLGVTVLQRTPIAHFHIEQVAAHVGVDQPEIALRLIRTCLDRELSAAAKIVSECARQPRPADTDDMAAQVAWHLDNSPEKPLESLLENSHDWDFLATLAETAPGEFMHALWPWFTEVLKALVAVKLPIEGDLYPLPWTLDFRFDGEDDDVQLPPSPILSAFEVAAENLAKVPDDFRSWLYENLALAVVPAQRLFAHALTQDGKTYAEDALNFLMGDSRRLQLGSIRDTLGTTKALLRAASPYWSASMLGAFVQHVRKYQSPAVPSHDSQRKRLRARALRRLRLDLLRALPQDSLDAEAKTYIRQESRVFGDERSGIRFSGFRHIGSPMSTEAMFKASDEDILNAFRELPDHTEWDHPRDHLKGGNVQLSRAFAEFAKQQPERAVQIIARFDPEIGSRAAGSALESMGESAEPDLVIATFLDVAHRGFVGEEFRGSAARAIEHLVERKVIISDEVLGFLQDWLADTADANPDEGDDDSRGREQKDEEKAARSILWNDRYMIMLPHGNYPIVRSLTWALLARGEHDRIISVWEDHLERRESPKFWRALLHLMPYLNPTEEDAHGRLLGKIFQRYPDIAESLDAVNLIGHAHWWAPDQVRAVLESWGSRDDAWLQQVFGEVVALMALVQPELGWPHALLTESLASGSPVERRIGVAFTAANVWDNPKLRPQANMILLALIPSADFKIWSAILDVFRVAENFADVPETASLLETMAAHFHKAGAQTNTFLVDRLLDVLPEHAVTVGRLVEGVIVNMSNELGDIQSGLARDAPNLVDIALTLHRLGDPTREVGVQLFEALLRIDAYSARATLEEIDSRFRTSAYSPRRRRLPRRDARRRRGRPATSG
jgi:hypothetical protein